VLKEAYDGKSQSQEQKEKREISAFYVPFARAPLNRGALAARADGLIARRSAQFKKEFQK